MTIFRLAIVGLGLCVAMETYAAEPTSAKPLGNPGQWILDSDYPLVALRERQQGVVAFQLQIDRMGKVEKCEVTASSGSNLLDALACEKIAQRATFSPALDATNQPTSGAYSGRIRWVLPKRDPRTMMNTVNGLWEVTFIVETDGKVSDCKVLQNSMSTGVPIADPCDPKMLPHSGRPVTTRDGQSTRARVTMLTTSTMETRTTLSDP